VSLGDPNLRSRLRTGVAGGFAAGLDGHDAMGGSDSPHVGAVRTQRRLIRHAPSPRAMRLTRGEAAS
jgi:hypothetical protein